VQLTGYIRQDGRVGFRNHIAVVPLAGGVQGIANRIADGVNGAVAFTQSLGHNEMFIPLEGVTF